MSLSARDLSPELMDDPEIGEARHLAALAGLARINRLSGVAAQLWKQIRPLAPVRVLDVGCGGGDVLLALARRAARAGVTFEGHGVDLSARAVDYARRRASAAGLELGFSRLDALRDPLPDGFDVVLCSLFLHHLDEAGATQLMASMGRAAARRVIVCDLARGLPGLALAWVGTRLLSRSPVVHADGPQSVRAAFTSAEAAELATRAGLPAPRVVRQWPCRWLLTSRMS